jgi:hypothetical protein
MALSHTVSAQAGQEPEPPLQQQITPAPPTPIAEKKAELGEGNPWNPDWDRLIEENLPNELVSHHVAHSVHPLCPRFGRMSHTDRRAFWAYFFQALAAAEAGLEPTADVRHADPEVAIVDTVTHHTIRQEGLLQLAYMDRERYGCDFDWKRDKGLAEQDPARTILQPRNNLLCGIRILNYQLVSQHKPLLNDSSYWVTLRPDSPSLKVFLRQMANVPSACGSSFRTPGLEKLPKPSAPEAATTQSRGSPE